MPAPYPTAALLLVQDATSPGPLKVIEQLAFAALPRPTEAPYACPVPEFDQACTNPDDEKLMLWVPVPLAPDPMPAPQAFTAAAALRAFTLAVPEILIVPPGPFQQPPIPAPSLSAPVKLFEQAFIVPALILIVPYPVGFAVPAAAPSVYEAPMAALRLDP
jgi:hypothetical protein